MDLPGFVLASVALLATPGPTNTLLCTSGALAGFRHSLPLLFAELSGYNLAISTLLIVLGPALASYPGLKVGLQVLCGAYLAYSAYDLWLRSDIGVGASVSQSKVFITTLLNPKGFVFASSVIPGAPLDGFAARLPWLLVLSVLIACVGTGWIYVGAATRKGTDVWPSSALCCQTGALALVTFAAFLWWSAAGLAVSLYGG
jgi:threonine/homoserine/homoserine lactone efflux protein